ncbi:MAG TPA: HIT domain-containing protein, partial [Methylomirabilota bacterium]|nr:HIT domain-containing protein [Methylomirabilota bacterium]
MGNCIFCKIAKREIPKEFTYEDDDVMVFPDIHPVRPVHLLIIPKQHFSELITVTDPTLFQKLFIVVQKMVKEQGLEKKGYRVTING